MLSLTTTFKFNISLKQFTGWDVIDTIGKQESSYSTPGCNLEWNRIQSKDIIGWFDSAL